MENQKGNLYLIIAIIVGVIAIGAVGFASWKYFGGGSELEENGSKIAKPSIEKETEKSESVDEKVDLSSKASATEDWKTYRNGEYGFEIILLDSWNGYSVLEETWNGVTSDGKGTRFKGPQIIIRHPEWTLNHPWQDIPIMVFTNEEWNLVEAKNLNVSAAPIDPRKLDQNQNYVFALPPRWVGFTDNLGQDEATKIIKTFKAFQIKDETADNDIYKNEKYNYRLDFFNLGYEAMSNTFATEALKADNISIRNLDEPLITYKGITFKPSLDIEVRKNTQNRTLSEIAQTNFELNKEAGYTKTNIFDVNFDDVKGKQFDVAGGLKSESGYRATQETSVIYLIKSDYIYLLTVPSNHKMLNKIMYSLEFIKN